MPTGAAASPLGTEGRVFCEAVNCFRYPRTKNSVTATAMSAANKVSMGSTKLTHSKKHYYNDVERRQQCK